VSLVSVAKDVSASFMFANQFPDFASDDAGRTPLTLFAVLSQVYPVTPEHRFLPHVFQFTNQLSSTARRYITRFTESVVK
jgi:hypothetical protein